MIIRLFIMLVVLCTLYYKIGYCSPPSLLSEASQREEEMPALNEKYIKIMDEKKENADLLKQKEDVVVEDNRIQEFMNQEMEKEKEIRKMNLDLQKMQIQAEIIKAQNDIDRAKDEGRRVGSFGPSCPVNEKATVEEKKDVFLGDLEVAFIACSDKYKEAVINWNEELIFVKEGQKINEDLFVKKINKEDVVFDARGEEYKFNLVSRDK